jgi:low affinity Fe/Cu permease
MPERRSGSWFTNFARTTARLSGRPGTFGLAVAIIIVWGVTGPLFHFSDTWQLVINTGTTIVTFLMVDLIQNTQNRDSEAVQIKLDELVRAVEGARNALIDLEDMDDKEIEKVQESYKNIARTAREDDPL